MARGPRKPAPFPTRDAVLAFIRESPVPVGKREIARAFHLSGEDRVRLRELLRELQAGGTLERGRGRRVAPPHALPEVAVIEVVEIDPDGELIGRPSTWQGEHPPRVFVQPDRAGAAPGVGDRMLARLRRLSDRTYEARIIRRLDGAPPTVLGIFERGPAGGRLRPTDRRQRADLIVPAAHEGGAEPGELVLAHVLTSSRAGFGEARIVERLGSESDPRAASLIAIHSHEIPTRFPPAAVAEAEAAEPPTLAGRTDLRSIPLVTIDGADARDFDDAVWAEPDPDPANPGGWHLLVAIADVAAYVSPGGALDRSAFERGNSVYFPDRVVPMLPEALSNELCSLKPGVERACMAAHLWIDAGGRLLRHRFERGLMRSAARLTYDQVQAARDGKPDDLTGPLVEPILAPLYGAFQALADARQKRGTLELDLPERQVSLTPDGRISEIRERPRYDSHRLIEEFMIAANVAAAETLEARHRPCLYRVHDQPSREKLDALREFLSSLDYRLAKGQVIKPILFTRILERASGRPEAQVINQVILRSQAQAIYSPENIGHFGLALPRYAHFTSPIRRYADLMVHRGLIAALGFGADGMTEAEAGRLDEIGDHISQTERRAAAAERDALDRYVAAYLSDRVGETLSGRIAGVTRFGLFVRLAETGSDGFVPIATLPSDFYDHDERQHRLVGRRTRRIFTLGESVKARLVEADAIVGSVVLRLVEAEGPTRPASAAKRSQKRKI